ncbi:MAG: hypothetical protein IBX57_00035 [Gammaproteobacteria bacterium]|nr:hypothetical protein [Gammaproteobacteria bacterium]
MSEVLVPIHDPDRGFRIWHLSEIFRGPNTGRYIPNKDDLVLDWDTGMYRVVGNDLSTGLSRLEPWYGPKEGEGVTLENSLLGIDIGNQGESFRAYIDTSVTPHTLACDSRLHIHGTAPTSIKVFKGTDISDTGTVISAMYDRNNQLLGENIPLELVTMPDANNKAIKTPVVGHTLSKLDDGEVVTAVVYDDLGYVRSYSTLLVKNTTFIRSTEANRKYITSIHLESPFLDKNEPNVLRLPINVAISDVPVIGVVTYSDGSQMKLPANGGKFKLYGMTHFVSTIVGQKIPLVLTYHLSPDEINYGAQAGDSKHISVEYWGTTTEFEKSYSVKIFAFPRWVDGIRGYELDYWLYNLDRHKVYNITNLVTFTNNSEFFRPLQYNVKQKLVLSVEMDKVDTAYPKYKFVQAIDLTLMSPGTSDQTKWLVGFQPNQDPMYGHDLVAKVQFVNTDYWLVDITSGFNSKEEWLRHVYYDAKPLFNPLSEDEAPMPNLLVLKTKNNRYEVPSDDWDDHIEFVNDLNDGENLMIEFVYRLDETDLQLGVAALPVKAVQHLD